MAATRNWSAGAPARLYRDAIRASMQRCAIAEPAITAYLGRPVVAYSGVPSIHEQKWAALFMNGWEAWAEVRRTGQPQLTPAAGERIPCRLPYPNQERLYDPANFRTTTLWTGLWWMND